MTSVKSGYLKKVQLALTIGIRPLMVIGLVRVNLL